MRQWKTFRDIWQKLKGISDTGVNPHSSFRGYGYTLYIYIFEVEINFGEFAHFLLGMQDIFENIKWMWDTWVQHLGPQSCKLSSIKSKSHAH